MTATSVHTDRIKVLTAALQTKSAEMTTISNSFKDETGKGEFVITGEQRKAFHAAVLAAEEIKNDILFEQKAAGIGAWLDAPAGVPLAGRENAAGHQISQGRKSLSDLWMASEAYSEMKASKYSRFGDQVQFDSSVYGLQATKGQGDHFTAMGGDITLTALGGAQDVGLLERVRRPGRVRDLFPSETTTATELWGVRQTGYINRAATVAQRVAADGVSPATGGPTDLFGIAPRSDLTIQPFKTSVSTIAHLMYVHKETLADEPRIKGMIDGELVDGIKLAEDWQLLYGDGEGENLKGLTHIEDVQYYDGLASDPRSAQIRRAMTRILLAYYNPNGVVMHPLDWEALELETDKDGRYVMAVSIAMGGSKQVWRMPIIDTPACQQGQFFTGAFGQACKLYDRAQVSLTTSLENRDNFERRVVTVLGEERLAFLSERPEAMLVGSFTDYDPTP